MALAKDAQATRDRLIAAARAAFSRQGFERTTVREIAAAAGVNPALINRYFGGKERLFAEAVAIEIDFPDLSRTPRGDIGRALIRHFFARWDGGDGDDVLRVLIGTAATNDEGAARIRDILSGQIEPMVARVTGSDRARERACLIATQILGLAYVRYVLALPDTDLPPDTVTAAVGETIQRYLFAPLP